jgi:hypothetical protein
MNLRDSGEGGSSLGVLERVWSFSALLQLPWRIATKPHSAWSAEELSEEILRGVPHHSLPRAPLRLCLELECSPIRLELPDPSAQDLRSSLET